MSEAPTIASTLRRAADELRDAGVSEAQLVAQSLLAEALGRDRTYLIVNFQQPLAEDEIARFDRLLERRAAGEPLQYITGRQEFFGLEFEVDRRVLIPRPETELIVEEVIRLAADPGERAQSLTIVDLGTGSGCLAVTLAREIPRARVIATDISTEALAVAQRNARRHNVSDRISMVAADLLSAFRAVPFADFIVCNPPYVSIEEKGQLQREVRDWEPETALTDHADGLTFFRRLLAEAPARLRSGGHMLCEMGYKQAEAVASLVDRSDWREPHLLADLQGIPRTIVLERR